MREFGICVGTGREAARKLAAILAELEFSANNSNVADGVGIVSYGEHQGIVDGVFVSPFVRVTSARDRFAVDYKTAKADVERLAEAGILAELPGQHPKTYYAPEIFNIAYEGLEE